MQQTETTAVQTGPTTVQTPEATVETGGTTAETATPVVPAAPVEPTTLHDFTLGLLTDLDAREAFLQDPLGCLEAAGLNDITAGDVHDILPLVLDAASVPNIEAADQLLGGTELPAVDSLLQIAGNVEGVTGIADVAAAPSAITALVSDVTGLGDFSGLGDVSGTLDSVVSSVPAVPAVPQAPEVVSTVTEVAHNNVETVVGQAVSVAGIDTDVLVKNIDTDVLVKDVVDNHVLVKDVVDTVDVAHVTDNVVQNVAQVGDVQHDLGQVIGDVKVGGLDLLDGGVGNHNDVDIHF